MLIESPDGQKALLGRSKKLPPNILTCLAGFVDQAESVEEAVARECKEEAGVSVNMVHIVGSQPWPIGRAGSCELMLGCVGRAVSEELKVNPEEMDECRWVTRKELAQAIQRSKTIPFLMSGSASLGEFSVPPSWAIAHHLMLHWLNETSPRRLGATQVP
jgi:NAD+ diphosphatase